MQLHGLLPDRYQYESKKHFQYFKLLMIVKYVDSVGEDEVLDVLKKQYRSQKYASMVDLCSKIVWCIDPR